MLVAYVIQWACADFDVRIAEIERLQSFSNMSG